MKQENILPLIIIAIAVIFLAPKLGLFAVGSGNVEIIGINNSVSIGSKSDGSWFSREDDLYNIGSEDRGGASDRILRGAVGFNTANFWDSIPSNAIITTLKINLYTLEIETIDCVANEIHIGKGYVNPNGWDYSLESASEEEAQWNALNFVPYEVQIYTPSDENNWITTTIGNRYDNNTLAIDDFENNKTEFIVGLNPLSAVFGNDCYVSFEGTPSIGDTPNPNEHLLPWLEVTYCEPGNCTSLGHTCGIWDNGCELGTTIDCGSCPNIPEPSESFWEQYKYIIIIIGGALLLFLILFGKKK